MSEKYESIFEAARRLSPEQQWRLAVRLLAILSQMEQQASVQAQVERIVSNPEFVALIEETKRELAEMARSKTSKQPQAAAERGTSRRHFGAWDSGDERSADNDRIDHDLAREYGSSR